MADAARRPRRSPPPRWPTCWSPQVSGPSTTTGTSGTPRRPRAVNTSTSPLRGSRVPGTAMYSRGSPRRAARCPASGPMTRPARGAVPITRTRSPKSATWARRSARAWVGTDDRVGVLARPLEHALLPGHGCRGERLGGGPGEHVVHGHDDLVGVDGTIVLAKGREEARAVDHAAAGRRRDAELPGRRELAARERRAVEPRQPRHLALDRARSPRASDDDTIASTSQPAGAAGRSRARGRACSGRAGRDRRDDLVEDDAQGGRHSCFLSQ